MVDALVGRDRELLELRRVLTDDGPRSVVVTGPAGVGKSRLLAEVADAASASGWMVERVFASPSIRHIPLGAISHLLAEPALDEPSRAFHTSITHLRNRARGRRLLLVVDDGHDLDDGSAAFVSQLVVHGDARAVLAVRASSSGPEVVTALWKDGFAERLELDALERVDADRLTEQVLGGPADQALLDAVWRLTLGHPLYLLTGLRAARDHRVVERRGDTWELTAGLVNAELEELVLFRVRDLDPDARTILARVAVGSPLPVRHVIASGSPDALDTLVEDGLVEISAADDDAIISMTHPLYREVVAQAIPPDHRRSIEVELSRLMLADGSARPVDRLRAAVWLLDAERELDHDTALGAAGEAMRRGDYPLGERLAVAALQDRSDSTPARIELGRALTFLGRAEEAEAILVGARPSGDQEVTEVAMARGHALAFVGGRPDGAATLLAEAAVGLGTAYRARLDAERALYGALAGDFRAVFDAAEAVLANPESPELTLVTAEVNLGLARAMTAQLDGFDGLMEPALGRAQRHAHELPLASTQLGLSRVAGWAAAGRIREAEHVAREQVAEADAAGAPSSLWLAWHGFTLGERGHFDEAIEAQRRALALFEVADPFRVRSQSIGLLALHEAQTRRLPADIHGALDAAEREAAGETRLAVWIGRARVWTAACDGRLPEAATLAADTGRRAVERDHIAWGAAALHDAVRLGHPDVVRPALEEVVSTTSGARLLDVMRDHAIGLHDGDAETLEAAARELAACGSPLLAAEASAQLARLLDERGDRSASCRASLCARLWHSQCAAAATPALDAIPPGLSLRESSIARDAADGLTSRAIADRMFISVRTVDNHLHAVYTKLDLAGRDELAGLIPETALSRSALDTP